MDENYNDIIIDFGKIWKILLYRKYWVLLCFVIVVSLSVFITLSTKKTYTTEAKIFINKSSSTNLSDINPFVVSDTGASAGGLSSLLGGGGVSNLGNEIEILKSPMVLDQVIRDNNLRYKSGLKKGKYLSAEALLDKNLVIELSKSSNVIKISYKSKDPKYSYDIVCSILNNYKKVYEQINSKKAINDRDFLEKSYVNAKKSVEAKISGIKQFISGNNAAEVPSGLGLVGLYDKRLNSEMRNSLKSDVENKKLKSELDMEVEKLKLLKTKYEWSNLVANMAENSTNVVILKAPVQLENFEGSMPDLGINIILALIISAISSLALIIGLESADSKLTYSDLDEKRLSSNINNIDFSNLQIEAITNNLNKTGLISLVDDDLKNKFADLALQNKLELSVTSQNDSIDRHIQNIRNSQQLIFLVQVGHTDKKLYKKIKDICAKFKKNIVNEFDILC